MSDIKNLFEGWYSKSGGVPEAVEEHLPRLLSAIGGLIRMAWRSVSADRCQSFCRPKHFGLGRQPTTSNKSFN